MSKSKTNGKSNGKRAGKVADVIVYGRVPAPLLKRAQAKADKAAGEVLTVSRVVRRALVAYVGGAR